MLDPTSIVLIVGVGTLLIEKVFKYLSKVSDSECFGVKVHRNVPKNDSK